jgi:hypothetical protein
LAAQHVYVFALIRSVRCHYGVEQIRAELIVHPEFRRIFNYIRNAGRRNGQPDILGMLFQQYPYRHVRQHLLIKMNLGYAVDKQLLLHLAGYLCKLAPAFFFKSLLCDFYVADCRNGGCRLAVA